MAINARVFRVALPVVFGIGVGAAVVFGGERGEPEATLRAGATLVAVLEQAVSAERVRADDEIALRIVEPLSVGEGVEIPVGSELRAIVTEATSGDSPRLGMRFTTLVVDGDAYPISTELYRFGTLKAAARGRLVLPAGHLIRVRVTRPLTVD